MHWAPLKLAYCAKSTPTAPLCVAFLNGPRLCQLTGSYFYWHALMCKEDIIFPILSTAAAPIFTLCFSAQSVHVSLRSLPEEALSALIVQLSQAWAGTCITCLHISSASVFCNDSRATGLTYGGDDTDVHVACFKAQFLDMGCVDFTVDWAVWYFHCSSVAPRPVFIIPKDMGITLSSNMEPLKVHCLWGKSFIFHASTKSKAFVYMTE